MRFTFLAVLCGVCGAFGQTSYTGMVDSYAIALTIDGTPDAMESVYTYLGSGEPVVLTGKWADGDLVLYEKNKSGSNISTLNFPKFDKKTDSLKGSWTNIKNGKVFKIALKKDFDINDNAKTGWKNVALMQSASLENAYFKLAISRDKANNPVVSGVHILEKETNNLLQKIDVKTQFWGLKSMETGDYNFDGQPDFSVFEQSYAGPNTSRMYFVYDAKTKQYVNSGFKGISLAFNSETKEITETNQCCAGAAQTVSTYKLVGNKMVLIHSKCFMKDEKSGEMMERPLKECK